MNAAVTFNPSKRIDVLDLDGLAYEEQAKLQTVVELFHKGVAELRTLIESGSILFCPVSQGKDSTICELMALEAYKQAIEAGTIESQRPLILTTVDTLGEAIPMTMYVRYARARLIKYAKQIGINIFYDLVKPTLNNEYFIKFTGGQKLIPNATRRGDCSVILKVDPSERYVKNLIRKFKNDPEYQLYADAKVICCVGSRDLESARRSNNMAKQGLSKKSVDDLMQELQCESIGQETMFKFAPIKGWATDQVFDALRLAGGRPLKKCSGLKPLPAFLPDFGLLLEIYGNGSNETCELTIGSTAGSGCNGKARFGCTFCTMIAVTDHSSTALSELPRWSVLGVKNALRVRDFLFRLSCDIDARALHARAFDAAGYNRVALQPNTLKPKHLEKMVRFASQLTLDSIRIAEDFKMLVEQGRELEHPGLKDIFTDPNISPKTKKAFIVMYRECVQDPENLNYLFSQEHALLLSFRWSIDGIGAAPFRPLAIWNQLTENKGWIPYPMLNSEYEAKHGPLKLQSDKRLPEAVMMPILKEEEPKQQASAPLNLLDLWQRPTDMSDIYDEDRNCTISRLADNLADIEIAFRTNYNLSKANTTLPQYSKEIIVGSTRYLVEHGAPDILSVKLNGLTVSGAAKDKLITNAVFEEIENRFYTKLESLRSKVAMTPPASNEEVSKLVLSALEALFPAREVLKRKVQHLRKETLFAGYATSKRNAEPSLQFTQRVTKVVKGKVERGNTRLSFYPIKSDSRIHSAHKQVKELLVPSFITHTEKTIVTHDASLLLEEEKAALENILISEEGLEQWKLVGGLTRALEIHDEHLSTLISKRHQRGYKISDVRSYGGTHVAESMLAEGVISINKKYWSQLQSILKRTQIFNDLGMYSFQSMTVEAVEAHPKAISMSQHRTDKAQVMLAVRELRNAQRAEFKTFAASGSLHSISQNLNIFKAAANGSIESVSYELTSSLLKMSFDTHEVSPSNRAQISSLWLSLNLDEVSHIDHVLRKVITPTQFKFLKSTPVEYLEAGKAVLNTIEALEKKLNLALNDWAPLLTSLKALIANPGQEKEAALIQFRNLINDHAPIMLSENDILCWWNPSLENMTKYLSNAITIIDGHNAHLSQLRSQMRAIRNSALRQVTRNLSLSDKLALMHQRKAA